LFLGILVMIKFNADDSLVVLVQFVLELYLSTDFEYLHLYLRPISSCQS